MSEQDPGSWEAKRQSVRRRSVSLREQTEQGEDLTTLMDPATKSLADALRITYRLLMVAIAVLGVLYVGSGVQTVDENEVGVRVLFGKINASDLGPGVHPSAPRPLGELLKVETGTRTIDLLGEYWPMLTSDDDYRRGAEALQDGGGSDVLDPTVDGFSVTADASIVHTQWQVEYVRADAAKFIEWIGEEHEQAIVRAAVGRGVVHAISALTIDEVLRNAPDEGRAPGTFLSAELMATQRAQETLDQMNTGLRIVQLSMQSRSPPRRTIDQFRSVEKARSNAGEAIENAQRERRASLASVAGEAAEPLLALIGSYESALEGGRDDEAERVLAQIDEVLEGAPIDGESGPVLATGKVRAILEGAKAERVTIASTAAQKLDRFEAALAAYEQNPALLLKQRWRDAVVTGFYDQRSSVEVQMLPESIKSLVLMINRDPEFKKGVGFTQRLMEGLRVQEERDRDFDPTTRQNARPR